MAEKIGIVGVGRMGANMARRLKEVGYAVTAVYDVRAASAQSVAQEIGCEACVSLARVTALADVIITVVTEHKCVLDTCRHLEDQGFTVTYLPVQPNGLIQYAC